MRLYVGVTDGGWFDFLASRNDVDEVNFWRPGGGSLNGDAGMPFLFKLKSPRNAVGGVAFFEFSRSMPIRDAWEFYREKNGAASFDGFRALVNRNRRAPAGDEGIIGCVILSEPTFFTRDQWVTSPSDWSAPIVAGKYYDLATGEGARLWNDVSHRLGSKTKPLGAIFEPFGGVGDPSQYLPRRGQGTFRYLVLDAYKRRCAVTGEKTLPVVQAAHIKPFSEAQAHEVRNGIALRSDIHTLFDRGYVTVTPDFRFHVSPALREDYSNGRVYYELENKELLLPDDRRLYPAKEYLEWHSDEKFKSR